ncbi:MAG: alcohol dehydrogenase catalytic domain-containing protein, partial [Enterococcus casseliflavus]
MNKQGGKMMQAVTWQGNQKMDVRRVEDPTILEPTDAIIRITATAICGSDLHLYHHGGHGEADSLDRPDPHARNPGHEGRDPGGGRETG